MIAINDIPYFFIVSLLRNVGKALIRSFRLFFSLAPSFYIDYFTIVLAPRQFSKIVSRETIYGEGRGTNVSRETFFYMYLIFYNDTA